MAGPVFATAGAENIIFSGTAQAVSVPAGLVLNDVVLLFVDCIAPITIATPSGFTAVPSGHSTSASNANNYVFWKRQSSATGAGETTGNYAVTLSGSGGYSKGVALRFSGCVTSGSPLAADNKNTVASGTASAAVSLTTTGPNQLAVLMVWSDGDITSFSQPSGFVVAYNGIPSGDNEIIVSTKLFAAAGATGSLTGTFGVGGDSAAWLGALQPPAAANPGSPFFAMM